MQFCVRVGLRHRPDLVIISQGINFDGHSLANICWRMGLPYVLISQKAANMYWPSDNDRDKVQAMYARARAALFVSRDNIHQTEEQLGGALPNAVVVRNPILLPDAPLSPVLRLTAEALADRRGAGLPTLGWLAA